MSQFLSKRVSNYELFFDLAVVLAIGQLTSAIHLNHIGLQEVLAFITTNIIIFNIWHNEVLYFNKYGDSRLQDIYTIIALMFIVGNISLNFSLNIKGYYAGNPQLMLFNFLLMLAYAFIALQYFLKGKKLGFSHNIKLSILSQLSYSLPLAGLALGLLPLNIWTALIYLLPNLLPIFSRKFYNHQLVNFPHIVERLHLVTLLTFGESVIAIIKTYPLKDQPLTGFMLFFGMATLFVFYMGQTFLNINHHQETTASILFYAHLPIFAGINIFTVGIEFLAESHHANIGFILFLAGIISFYLGVLATSRYNKDLYRFDLKAWLQYSCTILTGFILMILLKSHLIFLALILVLQNRLMMRINMANRHRSHERHNVPHPDPSKNFRDFS